MQALALSRITLLLLPAIFVLFTSPRVAVAKDIFDSVLCRAFGCVLLHNSHNASLHLLVGAEGMPAIVWQQSAATPLATVEKGTRDVRSEAGRVQSGFLGFDRDGDGLADNQFEDANNSGYLDAGDTIQPQRLRQPTKLTGDSLFSDSAFWVAANAPFGLRARAKLEDGSGELGAGGTDFSSYGIAYSYSRNGRVADVRYGRFTRNAFCSVTNEVDSLADIAPQPRNIFRCARRSVVYNNARSDLMDFSSLLSADYSISSGYDLSMGVGNIEFSVVIDVVN